MKEIGKTQCFSETVLFPITYKEKIYNALYSLTEQSRWTKVNLIPKP